MEASKVLTHEAKVSVVSKSSWDCILKSGKQRVTHARRIFKKKGALYLRLNVLKGLEKKRYSYYRTILPSASLFDFKEVNRKDTSSSQKGRITEEDYSELVSSLRGEFL